MVHSGQTCCVAIARSAFLSQIRTSRVQVASGPIPDALSGLQHLPLRVCFPSGVFYSACASSWGLDPTRVQAARRRNSEREARRAEEEQKRRAAEEERRQRASRPASSPSQAPVAPPSPTVSIPPHIVKKISEDPDLTVRLARSPPDPPIKNASGRCRRMCSDDASGWCEDRRRRRVS